jgi:ABC-type transport system involved in multi-copper enzyme maturation permease subunit
MAGCFSEACQQKKVEGLVYEFKQIFALEFRYQVRRATTWLYFGVILGLAFLIVIGNYSYDARDGYFLLNAPIVIAAVTVICSVKWLVIAASVAGDAAARDLQTRMHSLTYSAPTSKAAYLGGRFLAAFALNVLILLAIPAGILLAIHFSAVEADILVPSGWRPTLLLFPYCGTQRLFRNGHSILSSNAQPPGPWEVTWQERPCSRRPTLFGR